MRKLLAFVHIEKAAGTTLIHILRRSFFLRYLDVRPLRRTEAEMFDAQDLKEVIRINPWVRAIGGHSVRPVSNLEEVAAEIDYVTVLRDPCRRFLSMFRYGVDVLKRPHTIEEFLENPAMHNFQTTKIAGSADLELAKSILSERFLAVGTVEGLDEFLVYLTHALEPWKFYPAYEVQNVGPTALVEDPLLEQYGDRILDVNRIDIELYRYVNEELLPRQRSSYGKGFSQDLEEFQARPRMGLSSRTRHYIDGAYRKVYVEPITGWLRKRRGHTAKGSY